MRFTCFSMLAIPNIQFQTWVNESYNAVKHEFAKMDFLIKSTHYLTKHRFSFPDDNSQIFNQFMLGGGQETEEGSKQSNFCDLLLKYLLSNFPWPSTSYTFQNILKIRRNWLLDENGSGIWQRTSWREKSDNISLRDRFSKMSAAEISVVATGIDLLYCGTIEINKRLWLKLRYTGLHQNHFDDKYWMAACYITSDSRIMILWDHLINGNFVRDHLTLVFTKTMLTTYIGRLPC